MKNSTTEKSNEQLLLDAISRFRDYGIHTELPNALDFGTLDKKILLALKFAYNDLCDRALESQSSHKAHETHIFSKSLFHILGLQSSDFVAVGESFRFFAREVLIQNIARDIDASKTLQDLEKLLPYVYSTRSYQLKLYLSGVLCARFAQRHYTEALHIHDALHMEDHFLRHYLPLGQAA